MPHAIGKITVRFVFHYPLPGEGQRLDFKAAMQTEVANRIPAATLSRWWYGIPVTTDANYSIGDGMCRTLLENELGLIAGAPLVLTPAGGGGPSNPTFVDYEVHGTVRIAKHGFPLSLNQIGTPAWTVSGGGLSVPAELELSWPAPI